MLHLAVLVQNRIVRDERGATAIEYALLASLIALVIIGTVTAIGLALSGLYADVVEGFPT